MTVTSGPPKIVSLTDDVTVVEGSSVDIVCDVTNDRDAVGTQNVTILWFSSKGGRISDDGRFTIANSSTDSYQLSFISTLTINPVLREDTGQYTCQALNHVYLRDNEITNLTVECELVYFILQFYLISIFFIVAPIVTITTVTGTNQSAVNVTVGEELDITCKVESYPYAQVHWEADGVTVVDSSEVVQLKVTANSTIRGAIITYTCVAENVVGENNHSVSNNITVYVQGKMLMSI